jgi:hypothetical protein
LNRDVQETIDIRRIPTPEDLIHTVQESAELEGHCVDLATRELHDAEARLDEDDDVPALERATLLRTVTLLRVPDRDRPAWLHAVGGEDPSRFIAAIETWLDEPVIGAATALRPSGWSGQGKVLAFFSETDDDTLDALGVVIVEGQHPGSSHHAAALRQPIADANVRAAPMKLPYRFAPPVG